MRVIEQPSEQEAPLSINRSLLTVVPSQMVKSGAFTVHGPTTVIVPVAVSVQHILVQVTV